MLNFFIWFYMMVCFAINIFWIGKNQNHSTCAYLIILLTLELLVLLYNLVFTKMTTLATLPTLLLILLTVGSLMSVWWEENIMLNFWTMLSQQMTKNVYYLTTEPKGLPPVTCLANSSLVTLEYLFSLVSLLWVFITLTQATTLWTIYLYMELSSMLILMLFGWKLNVLSVVGAIWYFFMGFISSLCLGWGFWLLGLSGLLANLQTNSQLALSVNPTQVGYPNNNPVTVGVLLITLAFLLKLGIFPYHGWVMRVYPTLNKYNFLISLTLITAGYWYSFLNLLVYLLTVLEFLTKNSLVSLLTVVAVGSTLLGAFLLHTQNTWKGMFTVNSIMTGGFIALMCSAVVTMNYTNLVDSGLLLWFLFLYLSCYLTAIFISYNVWSAFILYFQVLAINYTVIIYDPDGIKDYFLFNKYPPFTSMLMTPYSYWRNSYKMNLNILTTFRYYLVTHYADYSFYLYICMLFGFPPFFQFTLKFYLTLLIMSSGLLLPLFIMQLIGSIIITSAICRVLLLLSMPTSTVYS